MMSQQLELLTENPSQWTAICYVVPDIQKKEIKPFVALALKELEGYPDSRTSSLVNTDKFAAIREIVRHFARLRSAIKEPWMQGEVEQFLEGLKFSTECIEEFTALLCADKIYYNVPKHLRVKPGLTSMHWRIDISYGQSIIQSEKPDIERRKEITRQCTSVILTFDLTDGSSQTYRLSVSKFHELRYVIASALKSMIVLEKRKCMRRE